VPLPVFVPCRVAPVMLDLTSVDDDPASFDWPWITA
jgi:hypothetical protein